MMHLVMWLMGYMQKRDDALAELPTFDDEFNFMCEHITGGFSGSMSMDPPEWCDNDAVVKVDSFHYCGEHNPEDGIQMEEWSSE